jgi:predicted RNA-binding protein (TIGR00451 family)
MFFLWVLKIFFLTVYTCTALPDLIPTIRLNKGVEEFIYKGAHLMWPGVSNRNDLGEFDNDDLRRIVSSEGIVVAVGAMAMNSKELEEDENPDEGICCHILHHNKDKLYEMGGDK